MQLNKLISFVITDISIDKIIIQKETYHSLLSFHFKYFNYHFLEDARIMLTDKKAISEILKEFHDNNLGGHQGMQRTYEKINYLYFWDNMKNDIQDYIRKCQTCQMSKTDFKNNKSPMQITSTSDKYCERITMDIVGPLSATRNGNRSILTLQDDLTKFIQAFAIPDHTADTVTLYFIKFCTQFGFPGMILSDQGTKF